MRNIYKWNSEDVSKEEIWIILFVSRNKDNRDVENFNQRKKSFVSTKKPEDLLKEFEVFVNEGVENEFSRFYVSINSRSNSKTFKALQHKMLDEEFNLATMPQRIAAIASKTENAYEKNKWLFDFDPIENVDLEESLESFIEDVYQAYNETDNRKEPLEVIKHKTPNGYAVITTQRFDTRKLMEKWKDNVELKRDDLLCYSWKTKK